MRRLAFVATMAVAVLMAGGACGGSESKSDEDLAREYRDKLETQGILLSPPNEINENEIDEIVELAETGFSELCEFDQSEDQRAIAEGNEDLVVGLAIRHTYCPDKIDQYLDAYEAEVPGLAEVLNVDEKLEDFDDVASGDNSGGSGDAARYCAFNDEAVALGLALGEAVAERAPEADEVWSEIQDLTAESAAAAPDEIRDDAQLQAEAVAGITIEEVIAALESGGNPFDIPEVNEQAERLEAWGTENC